MSPEEHAHLEYMAKVRPDADGQVLRAAVAEIDRLYKCCDETALELGHMIAQVQAVTIQWEHTQHDTVRHVAPLLADELDELKEWTL